MTMQLYEYAIIRDHEDETAELLVDVQRILARNEAEVRLLAGRQIPEEELAFIANIRVVVRPF